MNDMKKMEEAREEFWNHPALKYANSMVTFQAVRSGTSGWTGESGNIALDKFAEAITILERARCLGVVEGSKLKINDGSPSFIIGHNLSCDSIAEKIKGEIVV